MHKLRRVSGEAAIRAPERLGFVRVRQCGSHMVLKKRTPEEVYIGAIRKDRGA